ncbi:MAG: HAMP domain-containing protein [Actinobacteria bacterium]|nr:MAG: HAMP domain-containing protein [Actinomycetota bacterium]
MSRLSVGARLTVVMTLIAIAAVLVSVGLASRSVDGSLNRFAEVQNRVEVAGPALKERVPPEVLSAEDSFIDARLGNVRMLGLGLALVFALASAGLVTVTLVRPLRRLTAATDRMGSGDLGVRAELGGGVELARLGAAFNRLGEALHREDELRRATAADIAHELRTPVTGILARIEAAQDGVMPDPHANLAAMHEETLRLARLIEDVGQLADAQKPALLIDKARVDLADVARARAEARADFFRAKGIEFVHDVATAPVHGDPSRLEQVVENLLSNALRYTDPGGSVQLRVRADRDHALLEVSDTGIGIAPEDQGRVFDRFWRSDRSRSRATGGAGIGLAVVRELVEAHDGDVTLESTPGRGTRFRVRLPALRRERVPVPTRGRALASPAQ